MNYSNYNSSNNVKNRVVSKMSVPGLVGLADVGAKIAKRPNSSVNVARKNGFQVS